MTGKQIEKIEKAGEKSKPGECFLSLRDRQHKYIHYWLIKRNKVGRRKRYRYI